jgi:hypothetical protein
LNNTKKNILATLFSTLIALTLIEIIFQFFIYKDFKDYLWKERYSLFEEGEVFQNVDNFFKFYPNKKILSETYYRIDNKFIKEYSYEITTNNYGLVQKNNIDQNKSSILFLGDSFVQGQGAEPWIDKFKGKYKNYQLINGGILGTGPVQFELMEKHIAEKYNIKKVIFFYIGDDMRRSRLSISDQTLKCLKKSINCEGNENWYGFQLKNKNPSSFLNFLAKYRDEKKSNKDYNFYKYKIKNFFSNLYIFKLPNNYLKQKFYSSKHQSILNNFEAIDRLYKKYKENIYFIQIKQKHEIQTSSSYDTKYTQKYIKKITNNHFKCNIENNIKKFHINDGHLNSKGYESLYKCTKKIMDKNLLK